MFKILSNNITTRIWTENYTCNGNFDYKFNVKLNLINDNIRLSLLPGNFTGKGTITYTDKDIVKYTGNFVNGLLSGNCQILYRCGNSYIGDVIDSKKQGIGIMYNKKGEIVYNGNWYNDKIQRYHTEFYSNSKIKSQYNKENNNYIEFNEDGKCIFLGKIKNINKIMKKIEGIDINEDGYPIFQKVNSSKKIYKIKIDQNDEDFDLDEEYEEHSDLFVQLPYGYNTNIMMFEKSNESYCKMKYYGPYVYKNNQIIYTGKYYLNIGNDRVYIGTKDYGNIYKLVNSTDLTDSKNTTELLYEIASTTDTGKTGKIYINGKETYIGNLNNNYEKHGYGIETIYGTTTSTTNRTYKLTGKWENNNIITANLQIIDIENTKIYEGEYLLENGKFLRHGTGISFYTNGVNEFDGTWHKNMMIQGDYYNTDGVINNIIENDINNYKTFDKISLKYCSQMVIVKKKSNKLKEINKKVHLIRTQLNILKDYQDIDIDLRNIYSNLLIAFESLIQSAEFLQKGKKTIYSNNSYNELFKILDGSKSVINSNIYELISGFKKSIIEMYEEPPKTKSIPKKIVSESLIKINKKLIDDDDSDDEDEIPTTKNIPKKIVSKTPVNENIIDDADSDDEDEIPTTKNIPKKIVSKTPVNENIIDDDDSDDKPTIPIAKKKCKKILSTNKKDDSDDEPIAKKKYKKVAKKI